jgi:GNAT superfamily N-acetyltransferase
MNVALDAVLESDLDRADAIFRTAFATYLRADPVQMFGDSDLYRSRWRAKNTRTIAARIEGELAGSNILTRWGDLGWFGPLTVAPERWDQGVAKALMEGTERVFEEWGVSHRTLFTFSDSPKHLGLYQKFGYWPGPLTAILGRAGDASAGRPTLGPEAALFSERSPREQVDLLKQVRELCGRLLPGLDVSGEVESVHDQRIGETLLLLDGARLDGFAVCQTGAGSEAGGGSTYAKFATVAPGAGRDQRLKSLLDNLEALAASRGAPKVECGCNTSHRDTLRTLLARGYRYGFIGVAMVAGTDMVYLHPEFDILDDWR